MKLGSHMTALAVLVSLAATPVLADSGKDKGKKHHKKAHSERHHDDRRGDDRRRGHVTYVINCPPGLAKKDPACIPPGQAKKHHRDRDDDHYHYRVGDSFRDRDYVVIRDYDRYGLERRDDWDYYRDGNRAYRIDSNTRKVLAVIELIDAFN